MRIFELFKEKFAENLKDLIYHTKPVPYTTGPVVWLNVQLNGINTTTINFFWSRELAN